MMRYRQYAKSLDAMVGTGKIKAPEGWSGPEPKHGNRHILTKDFGGGHQARIELHVWTVYHGRASTEKGICADPHVPSHYESSIRKPAKSGITGEWRQCPDNEWGVVEFDPAKFNKVIARVAKRTEEYMEKYLAEAKERKAKAISKQARVEALGELPGCVVNAAPVYGDQMRLKLDLDDDQAAELVAWLREKDWS